MHIEFNTREYRFTYGKEPKGRGMWAFFFEGQEYWAWGTYTEAKKACVKHIKEIAPKGYKGFVTVKVGT